MQLLLFISQGRGTSCEEADSISHRLADGKTNAHQYHQGDSLINSFRNPQKGTKSNSWSVDLSIPHDQTFFQSTCYIISYLILQYRTQWLCQKVREAEIIMLSSISSFLRATSPQGHCLELILVEWLLSGSLGSCHCSIPLTNCYIFFLPYTQSCRKEFEHCLITLFQTPLLYRTTSTSSTWLSLQERSGIQLREPTLSITQLAQSVDSHSSSGTCRPFFFSDEHS